MAGGLWFAIAMQTGVLNRRGFVAGMAAFAGLRTRADWLDFFKRDAAEPEDFHVLRRPFAWWNAFKGEGRLPADDGFRPRLGPANGR